MSMQEAENLKNQKKYKEALEMLNLIKHNYFGRLNQLVKREPSNQKGWSEKAFCENKLGLHQDAVYSAETLTRINPQSQQGWNTQGYSLSKLGRIDEALKCLDYSIKLSSNNEYTWSIKAKILNDLEKFKEALGCAEQAIKVKAWYGDAQNNKVFALIGLGKYNDALQWTENVLQSNQNDTDALCNKSSALNLLGKPDEALKWVEKALKVDSQSANCWNCKGQVLVKLKNFTEAISCFQKALSIDPKFKGAQNSLQEILTEKMFFQILSEQEQQQISKNFMEHFLQDNLMLWVGKFASLQASNSNESSLYFKYMMPYIMRQYEVSELKITEQNVFKTSNACIHYGTYKKQPVAIKEIQVTDELLLSLLREISILAFCDHNNIAILKSIHFNKQKMEVQIVQEKYFMDLNTAMFGKKPIKIQNQKQIVQQIINALSYIHEIGLTHDDLKLSNVMFKAPDMKEIILLNFGTSKINPESRKLPQIPVSYSYCPPEINENDHLHLNPKSDVFSLGMLIYEIVSGKKANAKKTPLQVYEIIQKKNFNFFYENSASGIVNIDNLVKNCYQLDYTARPTVKEIKDKIEQMKF